MKNDFTSTSTFDSSPILFGDCTTPGVPIPKEIQDVIPIINKAVDDFGLKCYPTEIEWLMYDGLSEIAAYGGFPNRYPHWRFGMAFEELSKGYEFGMHRIFEMVINSVPCVIYCLNSNSYTDNVTVIGHALGHNHFFKNNVFFAPTNTKMMNEFGNNRTRIMKYISRWGEDRIEAFIDDCQAIETLIDPTKAWHRKEHAEPVISDTRKYRFPRHLSVPEGHDYMEDWINPPEWIEQEQKNIQEEEIGEYIGLFEMSDKDIMGFLRDNAPLKLWEQDILSLLYDEAMYFQPQRQTKMINEGFASYTDFNIMARLGMPNCSIWSYADHKSKVLGGPYSENPYKMGFELLLDIEERWNKGRFGREYEKCKNLREKEHWDKQLGQGREKVFEVCDNHNDITLLHEYFTQELCDKLEFFNWAKTPSNKQGVAAEYKIVDRDWKKIKNNLIRRYLNGGLPYISLVDPNGRGKGILVLEHSWDGRTLQPKYSKETMRSLARIWKGPVAVLTKDKNENDLVYYCTPESNTKELKRGEYQQL